MGETNVKRRSFLKTMLLSGAGLSVPLFINKSGGASEKTEFSFVIFADPHIQPELGADEGVRMAIGKMNELKPDFIIGCGDLIMDALAPDFERIDAISKLYIGAVSALDAPLHNVIGNHDIAGWSKDSPVAETHPEFGKNLFRKRFGNGKTYTSFDFQDWHMVLLDSIGKGRTAEERKAFTYIGHVDEEQLRWLKQDLEAVGPDRPVVVATHIPLATFRSQLYEAFEKQAPALPTAITNSDEVWKVLEPHNVKTVVQGHLHINEELTYNGTSFRGIGAVSGAWWKGAHYGHGEGMYHVRVKGGSFTADYVPYGWKARA